MNQELIDEYKKHLDMSVIRASLTMTVEERLQRLEEMARLRDEVLAAMERRKRDRLSRDPESAE